MIGGDLGAGHAIRSTGAAPSRQSPYEGYVAERLADITAAARRAQDVGGGVLVR
ncbi:hypothetical protein [Streptomyces sp. NPDC048496]|uniref:hypothetical protein n=1 Tax=Streptomyces sp. NPDC048496 TaxID=3365558 RepID=UPI003715CD64